VRESAVCVYEYTRVSSGHFVKQQQLEGWRSDGRRETQADDWGGVGLLPKIGQRV